MGNGCVQIFIVEINDYILNLICLNKIKPVSKKELRYIKIEYLMLNKTLMA